MGPDMCGFLQQLLQGQQRVESQYASMQQDIRELKQNQASTSTRQGVLPGKPEPNPKEYVNAITLRSGKELQRPEPKQKLIEDNEQIGGEAASKDEQEDAVSKEETVKDKAKEVEKISFPGQFKKQILDRAKAVFENHLENTQMTLPIIDAFLAIPQLGKFLKDAILNKTKELQGMFSSCLCDLGASVSLMPYSVAKRLGFKSYKPARISLVLADRSVRLPIGLLEDLPLRIGEIQIPTDFIVLEMDEESIDPIILGRPFLATAEAIIDVRGGVIELHIGSEAMEFDVKEMMKKPTIGGQVFYIETMEELADELLEELNAEDPLQVVLTRDQSEHVYLNEESEVYKRFLDQPRELEAETRFLELEQSGLEVLDIRGSNTRGETPRGCMATASQAEGSGRLREQTNAEGSADQ
ncbi:uncharacterized protein LOC112087749 [Eutrema salsugineum]|uniref:uncharacterized protein LOC112087749 n=1 Tax=Eutrema salsugineum TaxID=72664 RepID=UPI000CED26C2|nr:uncharacterized protein LOC112087749 [Eutrema salsugineum]